MNETIKTILNRRSYRAYKPEQISKEELSVIIECGLCAPSAMNTQSWHFTVVQNQELISRINTKVRDILPETAKERMTQRNNGDKDFSVFYFAPTIILVSGREDDGFSPMNAAYATENMCLAAESLDIGSCIIGMAAMLFNSSEKEQYMKELGIPEGYKTYYAICLGYKGMEAKKPEQISGKVNYIY